MKVVILSTRCIDEGPDFIVLTICKLSAALAGLTVKAVVVYITFSLSHNKTEKFGWCDKLVGCGIGE